MAGGSKGKQSKEKQKGIIKTGQTVSINEACEYVETVKKRFESEGQVANYHEFLGLITTIKESLSGVKDIDVIPFHQFESKIKDLFRLHPDLVVGFNMFLPRQYHMDPDSAAPSSSSSS